MTRVPLLRLNAQVLIVPLHADVNDDSVLDFQSDLTERVAADQVTGVVIDVSALDIIDSYMARVLNDTGRMLRLLGASVVVCGMRPAVALTLVEMGRNLVDVSTAFNLERALVLLQTLMNEADGEPQPALAASGSGASHDPSQG
jgi:rsbT antagonist protein RsbS